MWLSTSAKFIPDHITTEEWNNYTYEQQMENYKFTPYRFNTDDVMAYNQATGSGTTIWFQNGKSTTLS